MRKCVGGKMLNQRHTCFKELEPSDSHYQCVCDHYASSKTKQNIFRFVLKIIDGDITQPREWGHMYKAAFDKDLIRASCQHVSRWPKNGGRQKILEKMVCCLDLSFPYMHRICPFWPTQPSSNVWWVCERRICSDEPQRACTSCCYCTINLWCHPSPPPA